MCPSTSHVRRDYFSSSDGNGSWHLCIYYFFLYLEVPTLERSGPFGHSSFPRRHYHPLYHLWTPLCLFVLSRDLVVIHHLYINLDLYTTIYKTISVIFLIFLFTILIIIIQNKFDDIVFIIVKLSISRIFSIYSIKGAKKKPCLRSFSSQMWMSFKTEFDWSTMTKPVVSRSDMLK